MASGTLTAQCHSPLLALRAVGKFLHGGLNCRATALSARRPAPKPVRLVCGRLEAAMGLAADLIAHVQLRGPQLIPLLRAASSTLGIASLPVLQVKAAGAEMQNAPCRPCPACKPCSTSPARLVAVRHLLLNVLQRIIKRACRTLRCSTTPCTA